MEDIMRPHIELAKHKSTGSKQQSILLVKECCHPVKDHAHIKQIDSHYYQKPEQML